MDRIENQFMLNSGSDVMDRKPGKLAFRLSIILGVVVYALVLEYAYVNFAADRFAYLRYYYVEPDRVLMGIGLCAHILTGWTLSAKWRRPSDVIAWMTFSLVVVPIGVIPFFSGAIGGWEAFGWSVGSAATLLVMNKVWSVRAATFVPIVVRQSAWLWSTIAVFSVATYGVMAVTVGLSIDLPGLFSVYDIRSEYKSTLAETSPLLGYLVSNQGNVINPLIMVLGAKRKGLPLILIGIVGQLLIYSDTGFKAIFLSVPVAVGLGWFLRNRSSLRSGLFLHSVNVIAILSIVIETFREIGIVQILVNRLMINAGYLTAMYADFYGGAPKHKWSYSFLEGVTQSPYQMSPAQYLGESYLGFEGLNANANFFADGFANWGIMGIVIEAAILLITALVLNSAARGLPISLVVGVLLLPMIGLVNGSPITSLLSYGFVLATIIFALCPREQPVEDVAAPHNAVEKKGNVGVKNPLKAGRPQHYVAPSRGEYSHHRGLSAVHVAPVGTSAGGV
ncbi:hypothetical protein [Microbacterium sp. A93]|uniref:hypothetical protein n=1 Tax=Microbacterium sp. A93 TaxID=3450716 RepID=UPI003F43411B